MLKPLTVVHAHKQNLIVFENMPRSVTPQEALALGRAIRQAGIDSMQGATASHTYLLVDELPSGEIAILNHTPKPTPRSRKSIINGGG